jgi:aminoglycoside phosphotransferase (APT) family kinase protein
VRLNVATQREGRTPDPAEWAGFQSLVQAIDPGATLLRTWRLRGGMSSGMTAFEIRTAGGATRRLVRRSSSGFALQDNPRAAAVEYDLLRSLRAKGLRVPAPVYFDASGERFAQPYLVVEYVDGAPEFAPTDPRDFVTRMAAGLAEIHNVNAALPAIAALSEYTPIAVRQRGHEQASRVMDVGAVQARLDEASPLPQRNRSALLHGDYWAGNVVWKDGRIAGVIDWEEARVGDPVADVAVSRLDILWLLGAGAMDAFTDVYRSLTDADLRDLPLWDLDAALRPSFNIGEWAAAWPELGRPDITEATMRAGHAQFVERAFAALRG